MCVRLVVLLFAASSVLTQSVTGDVDCGVVTASDGQPTNSRVAKYGDLPWHANVYRKDHTSFRVLCGASLVKTDVVISVAHCFWDHEKQQLTSPSEFAVAVGKLYIQWDDVRDVYAQKSNVTDIRIPPRFHDIETNYADDISVVKVSTAFGYTTHVHPVCLDFDLDLEKSQFQTGSTGQVAGWQKTTEHGGTNRVLKVMKISYVNKNDCLAEASGSVQLITSDKICARYGNGSHVCIGESGEGLSFPHYDLGIVRYYLRGIVSINLENPEDICNAPTALVGLTQVTKHQQFLMQNLRAN